jgi:hypothetical protein
MNPSPHVKKINTHEKSYVIAIADLLIASMPVIVKVQRQQSKWVVNSVNNGMTLFNNARRN